MMIFFFCPTSLCGIISCENRNDWWWGYKQWSYSNSWILAFLIHETFGTLLWGQPSPAPPCSERSLAPWLCKRIHTYQLSLLVFHCSSPLKEWDFNMKLTTWSTFLHNFSSSPLALNSSSFPSQSSMTVSCVKIRSFSFKNSFFFSTLPVQPWSSNGDEPELAKEFFSFPPRLKFREPHLDQFHGQPGKYKY